MAWAGRTSARTGEHNRQPLTRHCSFAQQQQRRGVETCVPTSWILVVPTICGTIIFLAALVALYRVYKHGGARDAREFARAIVELRPSNLIATAVQQARRTPSQRRRSSPVKASSSKPRPTLETLPPSKLETNEPPAA